MKEREGRTLFEEVWECRLPKEEEAGPPEIENNRAAPKFEYHAVFPGSSAQTGTPHK